MLDVGYTQSYSFFILDVSPQIHPFFMLDVAPSHTSDNGRNQSSHHVTALTSDHERNQSSHHVRKAQHLYLTMEGTNPLTMSEWLSTDISLPLGRNINTEDTKLLPKVFKIHPS